jgi:hypothetical protein
VATNLRISLTILTVGFAAEGAAEVYSLLDPSAFLPGTSLLFLLPVVVTLLGLLFIYVGRTEWNDMHRARVRRANAVFGLSLLCGIAALAEVGLLAYYASYGIPGWAPALFGALLAAAVFGTFVVYAQLVFHLVHPPTRAVLVASLVWALIVSALVGATLATDLPTILSLIGARSLAFDSLVPPIDYLVSFLFVSYFLLLAAYVDAHVTVARGLKPAAEARQRLPPGRSGSPARPSRRDPPRSGRSTT